MPKLPVLESKELIKWLKKLGFREFRQKGSHLILINDQTMKQVVVPVHNKPLKKGTLASILRQAEISLD